MSSSRLVILAVAAALLLSIAGIIVLAVLGHPIPDVLQNIGVGSLTGLVGLLVTPPRHPELEDSSDTSSS